MPAEFSFDASDDGLAALDRFRTRSTRLQAALVDKFNELNARLAERIQTRKLLGQVLQYRTGTLFRSVSVIPATLQGSVVSGGVESSGGPAWYGRLHELGRPGTYPIPALANNRKVLHFYVDGREFFRRSVLFGSRTGGLKERSFMRSTQDEMRAEMTAEIEETVKNVLSAQPRDARGRFTSWNS